MKSFYNKEYHFQVCALYNEDWKIKNESGISNEMFDFLQFEVSSFQNDIDKECGLVIDEISNTKTCL